jgi:hypothetical protein
MRGLVGRGHRRGGRGREGPGARARGCRLLRRLGGAGFGLGGSRLQLGPDRGSGLPAASSAILVAAAWMRATRPSQTLP